MGIIIQDPNIGKQAKKLADRDGVSIEEAIRVALDHELEREPVSVDLAARRQGTLEEASAIIAHYQSLPLYDTRPADEILGYNAYGLPE